MPAIPAPTYVGSDLTYTAPVLFGPAQVFTISAVAATGAAVFARSGTDTLISNICAIRVGLDVAAWIDASGFWHVERNTGVTMTATGGGSYTLRVYNSAGNPMAAKVSIAAGSATVVAQADAVTAGPAWGSAPAVEATNQP